MKRKIVIIIVLLCLLCVGGVVLNLQGTSYAQGYDTKINEPDIINPTTNKQVKVEEPIKVVNPSNQDNENKIESNSVAQIIEEPVQQESVIEKVLEEPIAQELEVDSIEGSPTYELTETEFEIQYPEETQSQEIYEGEITSPEVSDTELTPEQLEALKNNEVLTIDAAVAESSVDGVEITFAPLEPTFEYVSDVTGKYLGLPNNTRREITVIGNDTLMDINKLQGIIDAGNLICYPSCDMTQGVKYLAGHNPGVMSHINSIKIGSKVRFSNDAIYQDYEVIERLQNVSGSFADAYFSTSGYDAWTMLTRGTENALIIQFCINGQNNLWYCRAV